MLSHHFSQILPGGIDKGVVSLLLDNAVRIFETAETTSHSGEDLPGMALLIGNQGSIHIVADCDWPLDSLAAHHGAEMSYRVSRKNGRVSVEGHAGRENCRLEREPVKSVARRLLVNQPKYLLAAGTV